MKKIIYRSGLSLILTVVLVLLSTTFLFAQEKGTQQVQNKMSTEIESIALAKQLVHYGYDKEMALPLINAAQIIIDENAGTLKVQETKRGEGKGSSTETVEITLNVEKLLTDAEAFAGDDKNIKGLIKSMRELTTASRGRVGGPGYVIDKVTGEEANIHTVEFEGGEAVEVAVVGDGSIFTRQLFCSIYRSPDLLNKFRYMVSSSWKYLKKVSVYSSCSN